MRRRPVLATGALATLVAAATALALALPGGAAGAPAAALSGEAAALVAQQQSAEDAAALGEPLTAPDDWALAQRGGAVTLGAHERAIDATNATRARTRSADPALAAAPWVEMGPTNVGGRVADLAIDPTDPDVVYAGTSAGGVWRSADGGLTFARAWDTSVGGAIGALAIGSDGVLWAGTGESNPGGGGTTYPGSGVYRSADQGRTWQRSGLPASGRFGRLVVDPTDPDPGLGGRRRNALQPRRGARPVPHRGCRPHLEAGAQRRERHHRRRRRRPGAGHPRHDPRDAVGPRADVVGASLRRERLGPVPQHRRRSHVDPPACRRRRDPRADRPARGRVLRLRPESRLRGRREPARRHRRRTVALRRRRRDLDQGGRRR